MNILLNKNNGSIIAKDSVKYSPIEGQMIISENWPFDPKNPTKYNRKQSCYYDFDSKQILPRSNEEIKKFFLEKEITKLENSISVQLDQFVEQKNKVNNLNEIFINENRNEKISQIDFEKNKYILWVGKQMQELKSLNKKNKKVEEIIQEFTKKTNSILSGTHTKIYLK